MLVYFHPINLARSHEKFLTGKGVSGFPIILCLLFTIKVLSVSTMCLLSKQELYASLTPKTIEGNSFLLDQHTEIFSEAMF